jgi:hypothetical protein
LIKYKFDKVVFFSKFCEKEKGRKGQGHLLLVWSCGVKE